MRRRTAALVALLVAGLAASAAGEVASTPKDVKPLGVGDVIPDVSVRDIDGQPVSLPTLVSEGPIALIFYRGGWCPFCRTRLGELQFLRSELLDAGVGIVAVGADRPEKLRESRDELGLRYTLLSDSSMEAARAFGVAYEVDARSLARFEGVGVDLEESSGEKHHQLPVASLFLVGGDGRIRFRYVSVYHRPWLEKAELLEAARAAVGN